MWIKFVPSVMVLAPYGDKMATISFYHDGNIFGYLSSMTGQFEILIGMENEYRATRKDLAWFFEHNDGKDGE